MENENIIELNIENLVKCGFESDVIERLLTWDNYEIEFRNDLGNFFASKIDNKIYTGTEAFRKIYFRDKENPRFPFNDLDLVEEYYNLKELNYLKHSKDLQKSIYDECDQQREFKQDEIKETKEIINNIATSNKSHLSFNIKNLKVFKGYLNWLEREQQSEPIDKSEAINELLEPKYILGLNEIQISKSYKHFKQHFEEPVINYKDYIDCFDENETPKHFKLIQGQNKYFIHFLTMAGANDKIAKERFTIKQFDRVKFRNNTDMKKEIVFVNQMNAILNK